MPHGNRKKGETGFHHVVSKGDGGQILFESDADRIRYLSELKDACNDRKVKVHAYCLMSNHVHLLIEDRDDNMSAFMKQLSERYAMRYRKVTGRVGHVFQGRFWNEPVERDEYFLAVLRYIHANPEPAGICRACDYPWSSYADYVGEPRIATTALALEMLGGAEAFESFHLSGGHYATPFPKSTLNRHLSYDELLRVASALLGRDTLNALKQMKPKDRAGHLLALARHGFTETQIARITGIGQASVYRAVHKS